MAFTLNQTSLRMTTANLYGNPLLNLSVNLTAGTGITVNPSPITGAGTISLTTPVTVPLGGTGATTLTGLLQGNGAGAITGGATVNLTSQVTGILPYANGGTNASTAWTQGANIFAGATSFAQDAANNFWDATNHRQGFGTNSPNVTLDVAGAFATRQGAVGVSNGLNSNITLPNASYVRLTGASAPYSVGGFTGGSDGRQLIIYNTTPQTLTIVNEDASSSAQNRIRTLTGANIVLPANSISAATFIYDSSDSRWIYDEPLSGSGTFVRVDGTTPLTASWNASSGTTNPPWTIQSRSSSDWFNVISFGAYNDSTNAAATTTAFQNAINAAAATRPTSYGGVVYIPAGYYSISSTLTVPDGISFIGDGAENAATNAGTKLALPTASDAFNITGTGGAPVRFHGIGFNSAGANNCTAGAYIHCNAAANFTLYVEECTFAHHFVGIQSNSNWMQSWIRGCRWGGIGTDIWINNLVNADQGGLYIVGNTFNTSGPANIRQTAGGGTCITGNGFIGSPTYAFLLDIPNAKSTSDVWIHDNSFEGSPTTAEISIQPAGTFNNILIHDNEFEAAGSITNIQISPAATGITGGMICANSFGGSAIGVDFSGAAGANSANGWFVEGNVFSSQTVTAIKLPSTAANVGNLKVGPNQFIQSGTSPYITNTFSSSSGLTPGIEQIFVQTADVVTTPNTLSTLIGTGRGSVTIPANRLMVGTVIRVTAKGFVSVATPGGTHVFKVLLGGTSIASGNSGVALTNSLNGGFTATAEITCRSIGAPGSVTGGGAFFTQNSGVSNFGGVVCAAVAGPVNVTTTGTLALDVQLNNGNATGTYTCTSLVVELIN